MSKRPAKTTETGLTASNKKQRTTTNVNITVEPAISTNAIIVQDEAKPTALASASQLEIMPTELLTKIFLALDPASMLAWRFTSRRFNAVTLTKTGKKLVNIQEEFYMHHCCGSKECSHVPSLRSYDFEDYLHNFRLQFGANMIQIELSLSDAVTSARLTCSGCGRTLPRASSTRGNQVIPYEHFDKYHCDRLCTICIDGPVMSYYLNRRRYERCRSCREFVLKAEMAAKQVLRKWIKKHEVLLDDQDVNLEEVACVNCFSEWKDLAIRAQSGMNGW